MSRELGPGAMLIVAALLAFGRTEAASGQTLGPSFDCASVREGLAAVICGSRELGPADLALVQAYQALRHQIGQPGLAPLRREAVEFSNGVADRCGIPKTGAVAASPGMVGCVKAAYEAQRASWQARLAGPAREEAGRPLEQHVQLQRALLGPGATADGVYGPGTRAAITAWQQSAGLAASGFLGDTDAKRLALSPPNSFPTATPAANSAPPSPGQAAARSTNQEVSVLAIEGRRLSRNLAGDYVSSGPIKICTSGLDTYPDVNAAISVLSQILRQEKGLSALERTWWNIEGESPASHECDAVAVTRPIRAGNSTYRRLPEILTITPALFAAEQARRERLRAEAERARAEAEVAKAARVREIRDGLANGVGVIRVSGGSVVCVLQTHANAATHLRDKRDGRAADLRGATFAVAGSLDNAFIDLKTRRCGAFFGEAPDLRRLMEGLGRDNLQMSLLDTWLTMQELGNAEAEFHEERRRQEVAAAERQRQAEEAARGASEAAARSRCEADPACRPATARGPRPSQGNAGRRSGQPAFAAPAGPRRDRERCGHAVPERVERHGQGQ
jgi:peptidoglycan hydrolase-like protein with peptidoglycan-binding domain